MGNAGKDGASVRAIEGAEGVNKPLNMTVEFAIMELLGKGLSVESRLTAFLNSGYRNRTLKRGFRDALFLADKVNVTESEFGGFCVYG